MKPSDDVLLTVAKDVYLQLKPYSLSAATKAQDEAERDSNIIDCADNFSKFVKRLREQLRNSDEQ